MMEPTQGARPTVFRQARRLATSLDWDYLIVPPQTRHDVEEALARIEHCDTILGKPGIGRVFRPALHSLFHAPSGTGKTPMAALLSKASKLDVNRIDVSMLVSISLGEAKRTIAIFFDKARANGWILFFNEADALFGQWNHVSHSNDR